MANKKISDFDPVVTISGSDQFLIERDSATYKTTAEKIAEFTLRNSQYSWKIETKYSDYDYLASELEPNHIIFVDTLSDITIGLFNGSPRNGAIVIIRVIGSTTYNVYLELYEEGTTDYILRSGDTLILLWDDTNSVWWRIYRSMDTLKNIQIESDMSLEVNRKYNITAEINVTLPETADEGDEIEISSEGNASILQNADNIISYLNKYFTTEGTDGYVKLKKDNNIRMVYKGTGYKFVEPGVKLSDPATKPAGNAYGCTFSPDGIYLVVAHLSEPYITIYKRDGDTFTKLSDPGTKPTGNASGCAFSPDGIYLAVVHNTDPYITIYKRSGDTFTKLSDPGTKPPGNASGCAFSPDGIYLAVAHLSDPYITIYKRSGDTFTKLSDPATKPTGDAFGCAFSPDGIYLAVAHVTTPYITIYKRSGNTFTKLANPASLPAGAGRGCIFSQNGNYLAVTHYTDPYITIYKKDGDTFTKLSDPATKPTGDGKSPSFSPDGNYLAVAHLNDPYVTIYNLYTEVSEKWIIKTFKTPYETDIPLAFV